MKNPPKELDILKKKIEDSFGLIPETKSDYDRLATRISNKLEEIFLLAKEQDFPRVSGTTISRIWEYVKSDVEISKATWSSLARSIGYKGWEDFCSSINSESDIVNNEVTAEVGSASVDTENDSSNDNESATTAEETTVDSRNDSSEENIIIHDGLQVSNNKCRESQRHYITDFDIINDTDTLGIDDTFYFCERGRYAELKYKGDCEFEIIDHSDKMRISEPITARWFEKIQVKNRKGEIMCEDIAGVVGDSYDRLYL